MDVLTDEVCAQLAQQIAFAVYARWTTLAKALPRAKANDYVPGIQEVQLDGQTATVALVGDRPNQIEEGEPGKDLRDTLLGPNIPIVPARQGMRGKHQSKAGGYYRAIPFRHQTPGSSGSFGTPMGSAYSGKMGEQDALAFGKALYQAAKALAPSTTEPFRVDGSNANNLAGKAPGTRWGGRLGAGFAGIGLLQPHHTTDIYAGMVRLEETYQNATQSVYATFRTISTNKTVGWHTKGTPGAHLMDAIDQELPEMSVMVLDAFAEGFGAGGESA